MCVYMGKKALKFGVIFNINNIFKDIIKIYVISQYHLMKGFDSIY